MKRKYLVILAILAAFAAGFYLGTQHSTAPSDLVISQETFIPIARSSVQSEPEPTKQNYYVLNKNTHKFHYPDCPSVRQMDERNKIISYKTRDEIKADGYDPCGRCHP